MSRTFVLAPRDGYIYAKLDLVECCPICGHFVVQVTNVNWKNEVFVCRKSNTKARKLYEKCKRSVIFERKRGLSSIWAGKRNYLFYNEYGVKKRCYSNISTMKLGAILGEF